MKYYNEAKSERGIRRKAMFYTFAFMFLLVSAIVFSTSSTSEQLPELIKELLDGKTSKSKDTKDKA